MSNRLEAVMRSIQHSIRDQNNGVEIYGRYSIEFSVARIRLNDKLETLQLCGYIDRYEFEFSKTKKDPYIARICVYLGDFKVTITEEVIKYCE